jgi:predicted DCC family thiol-disulfide oxidoreductase YuxK
MNAILSTQRPILIYDGDCGICRAITKILLSSRLVSPDRIKPYEQLQGDVASAVWAAGIRNEMVAVSPSGTETRAGISGMLWVLEEQLPSFIMQFVYFTPIKRTLTFLYKTIAYNRRVISPSSRGLACTCDPDYSKFYSVSFFLCCIVFASIITALFGAAIFSESGLGSELEGAAQMIGAAGSGWVMLMLASISISGQKQVEFLAHLGATMVVGVIVLVPAILLTPILNTNLMYALLVLSVVGSFTTMLHMQRYRIQRIGLPQRWVTVWVICLLFSSVLWTIFYFAL